MAIVTGPSLCPIPIADKGTGMRLVRKSRFSPTSHLSPPLHLSPALPPRVAIRVMMMSGAISGCSLITHQPKYHTTSRANSGIQWPGRYRKGAVSNPPVELQCWCARPSHDHHDSTSS